MTEQLQNSLISIFGNRENADEVIALLAAEPGIPRLYSYAVAVDIEQTLTEPYTLEFDDGVVNGAGVIDSTGFTAIDDGTYTIRTRVAVSPGTECNLALYVNDEEVDSMTIEPADFTYSWIGNFQLELEADDVLTVVLDPVDSETTSVAPSSQLLITKIA